jgi:hypothetical protein
MGPRIRKGDANLFDEIQALLLLLSPGNTNLPLEIPPNTPISHQSVQPVSNED